MAKVKLKKNKNSPINQFIAKHSPDGKSNYKIKVGVLTDNWHRPKGPYETKAIRMKKLAEFLNKGTDTVPPRPVNQYSLQNAINTIIPQSLREKTLKLLSFDEDLKVLLEKLVTDYKLGIHNFSNPANSYLTVQKKGFNNPLVYSRQYIHSIEGQINNGVKIGKGRDV